MKLLVSLLCLTCSATAFVVHPSSTSTGAASILSTTRTKSQALHLLEPSHVFDQVVSTLTVAADAVEGPPEAGGVSYSKASYYTILGLYLLSFPGLWSTVKRSTTAKVKRKTFVTKGEKASTGSGKSLREEAGGIMACKKILCL